MITIRLATIRESFTGKIAIPVSMHSRTEQAI